MAALIFGIVLFTLVCLGDLFFNHTRVGRRLVKQIDRWYVKNYLYDIKR